MLNNLEEYLEKDLVEFIGKNNFSIIHTDEFIKISLSNSIHLLKLLESLRTNKNYNFKVLIDLFIVDYPAEIKRFEINYNLLSVSNNKRLYIKFNTKPNESVPSIAHIFKSAAWLEREMWDMYGVKFEGNKDLRRLLTDYEFEGHPLRKDFPLTGYKEVRYDKDQKKVIYEDVSLEQEYRIFDFESPWYGVPNDSK